MTAIVIQDETNIKSPSRNSLEPKTDKRSVKFASTAFMAHTISRTDYTVAECHATWYSAEEYGQIRSDCSYIISLLAEGHTVDETRHCTRGLENRTKSAARARRQARFLAFDTVLAEQDDQWDHGHSCCQVLATVYSRCCHKSRMEAHQVGLEDAECAKKCQATAGRPGPRRRLQSFTRKLLQRSQ